MLNQNLLLTGDDGYNLTNSLRFRSSASAYLNRTPSTTTNRQIWTWSAWVKQGSALNSIFSTNASDNNSYNYFGFDSNAFRLYQWNGGSYDFQFITTPVYRDPAAWYHFVIQVDTTQATAANRVRLYVNGIQVTAFSTNTTPSQNLNTYVNNSSYSHLLARNPAGSSTYFDGYLDEINFIDGQALTPTSFGSTNALTGVWQPARYTGTYGTNGFYLPFTDNSALTTSSNVGLGRDYSGNGNYWTTNNISITAGTTYDSMTDVPTLTSATTANYCVLNPLDKATSFNVTGGNLNFAPANTSDLYSCRSTIQIPSTGKWIWEVTNTNSAYMITAGLLNGSTATTGQQTVSCAGMTVGSIGTFFSTTQWMNTTTSWSVTNIGNGDTLVIAYDADAGKIWFGRVASGGTTVTWYNTSGTADPSTGTDPRASGITAGGWFAGFGTYYTPSGASANFGQRPFAFTNTPTGFVALNTFNLPSSTIVAGNKQMDVSLYTGTGALTQTATNSGSMQPDFVWIKDRSQSTRHVLTDSVRGVGKSLYSSTTDSEGTDDSTGYLSAFNSNGFTVNRGSGGLGERVNYSGDAYVGWQWKAGGTAVTNTAGSISAQVSANTTSGFSVVTYTGNGTGGATVGHGLGVAPSMVIVKRRNGVASWIVNHTSAGTGFLLLENTAAYSSATTYWTTAPTSSLLPTLTSNSEVNASGGTYVAYCFTQIAGYSAMGSYVGNGVADGPFIYTGFRPRYYILKNITSAQSWSVQDTSRSPYNVGSAVLLPNSSSAELTGTDFVDILSNGFKIRHSSSGNNNNSGDTYIYMAFAENPFKNSLAR